MIGDFVYKYISFTEKTYIVVYMYEGGMFAAIIVSLLAGMLFAFSLVSLFLFFTPNESMCHQAISEFFSILND